MMLGLLVWLLGIACLGSFNEISDMTVAGMTLFDLMDFATANIMLPLGGLMICLFAGWRMKRVALEEELSLSKPWLFHAWYLAIRFVAPVAVAAIFVVNLYNKFAI